MNASSRKWRNRTFRTCETGGEENKCGIITAPAISEQIDEFYELRTCCEQCHAPLTAILQLKQRRDISAIKLSPKYTLENANGVARSISFKFKPGSKSTLFVDVSKR